MTEIHDYMRLLWARVGIPYSPATGLPIESQTVSQMVDKITALPEGDAALSCWRRWCAAARASTARRSPSGSAPGFQRLKIDGEFYPIEDAPTLDKKFKHDIDVVVDRIVTRPGMEQRLADSLETALRLADGIAVAEWADVAEGESEPRRLLFSEKFACPVSGFTISEIEPRLFSFNNPFGACPACDGLGAKLAFDADLVVPGQGQDPAQGRRRALGQGPLAALHPDPAGPGRATTASRWTSPGGSCRRTRGRWCSTARAAEKIHFVYDDNARKYEVNKTFEGVIPNLERRWRETDSAWVREELAPLPVGNARARPAAASG